MTIKPTGIVIFAIAVVIAPVALGHSGATGIVKERMDDMVAMGKALGSIADMFKGKTGFSAATVVTASDIIIEHSAGLEKLFPDTKESRTGSHTEALPAIWQNNGDFNALAKALGVEAAALKKSGDSGDQGMIRKQFSKTAKACSACHKDYRKKKE